MSENVFTSGGCIRLCRKSFPAHDSKRRIPAAAALRPDLAGVKPSCRNSARMDPGAVARPASSTMACSRDAVDCLRLAWATTSGLGLAALPLAPGRSAPGQILSTRAWRPDFARNPGLGRRRITEGVLLRLHLRTRIGASAILAKLSLQSISSLSRHKLWPADAFSAGSSEI